ncbi:MAG: hypothetical protein COC24_005270 [Alphaproteobacteria bacterium]|nr:hypothetical protein [Alphaproteobacteria bacterium]
MENIEELIKRLIATATSIAGDKWSEIKISVTHELKVLASRIKDIAAAVASKEMSKNGAKLLFQLAKNNLISTIAMTNVLVVSAVQKLVNAVLKDIKDFVNLALGFSLI